MSPARGTGDLFLTRSHAPTPFHVRVIDGVFSEDPEGSVQFHEATHLTASYWGELQHSVRHRVLRYFHRHGLLERHVTIEEVSASDYPAASTTRSCVAASAC